MVHTLIVQVRDGPLVIRSIGVEGVEASYDMWEAITAREFFPAGARSAKYVLSLSCEVGSLSELALTEQRLLNGLDLLSLAWPFAGGGPLELERLETIADPRFSSNRSELEKSFRKEEGVDLVVRAGVLNVEALGSYRVPPLRSAIDIAREIKGDERLRRALAYLRDARRGRSSGTWILDLMKVREMLGYIHGSHDRAKSVLNIRAKDWKWFGMFLNKDQWDNRHAPKESPKRPHPNEVHRAFNLARDWIRRELALRGVLRLH